MADRWYRTDNYFDPDSFNFNGPDVTTENVKAALLIRRIKPDSTKVRGANKLSLLTSQLKEFWITQKSTLNTTSITAGGSAGNSIRPTAPSASSLHQGFSLTNLVQGQSNSEILKRHVNESGSNFDSQALGTSVEGIMVYASVSVTEKISFSTGCFVIGSSISSANFTSDSLAAELFYLFSLSKVHGDRSVNLSYVDFVTPSGKRPHSIIDVPTNLVITVSVNRLLTVKPTSALHESFVRSFGLPCLETDTGLLDPKLDGLRKCLDTLNGKFIYTSIKPKDVPLCLLRTNMLRRLSEQSVIEHIRQTGESIDIKLETAWAKLCSMGESWDDDTSISFNNSLLNNTTRLRQIRHLPCFIDDTTYVEFLTNGWCRNSAQQFSYDGISLQRFSCSNLSSQPSSKIILSDALKNFEYFLVFCFGEVYDGVTSTLCANIQHGECAKSKFMSEFVRYQIEFMLSTVFQIIKDIAYSVITTHNITEPTGVKKFLQDRLTSVISNVTIEKQLTFFSTRNALLTVTSPSPVGSGLSQPPTTKPCRFFFFHQLGVTDNQNKLFTCSHTPCKFSHLPLSSITEIEANGYIKTWRSMKNRLNGKPLLAKPLNDKIDNRMAHAIQTKGFKP